jgi:hypothetical protein
MKCFQLVIMLGLVAIVSAQPQSGTHRQIRFQDSAKKPNIIVMGNEGSLKPGESFELSGNVQIRQVEEQTTITCAKATGSFVKVGGKSEFDNVKLTGGVKLSQVTLDKSGNPSSTVGATGNRAEYALKDTLREVKLFEDVVVTFQSEESKVASKTSKASEITNDMKTTAKSAVLTFKKRTDSKTKKDFSEMQSALIIGPIQFSGHQIVKEDNKIKQQKVTAKADQMRYTVLGASGHPEVRLEGNLEFHELGANDDGTVVEGANLLILILDDNFNIVSLKFSSSEGSQVKTTVSKGDGKGTKGAE